MYIKLSTAEMMYGGLEEGAGEVSNNERSEGIRRDRRPFRRSGRREARHGVEGNY